MQKRWSSWCSSLHLDHRCHSHTETGSLQLWDACPRMHKHGPNCLNGTSMSLLELAWQRRVKMNTCFCKGQQCLQILAPVLQLQPIRVNQPTSESQAPAKYLGTPARSEMPKQLPSSKLRGSSYNLEPPKPRKLFCLLPQGHGCPLGLPLRG